MESLLFASQALADAGEAAPMLGQLITQVDPTTTAVWMPGFLEFVAVIAGAVSGALTACDKRLDIVGAVSYTHLDVYKRQELFSTL